MNDYQARFQQLLRELFEFDCADLDFGIYRIMNHKRAAIERFIAEELPRAISEELAQGALAKEAALQQELAELAQQIRENLSPTALDADGRLAEAFHNTKLGQRYLELQARAPQARSREAREAEAYNHLYTFFSRYYQDGDFISKRRYSKKERYAIPYNGEEVYLYWANHDQYYIKTAEHFTDYSYKAPNGVTVHFKLKAADVEQNNVKGEKRFFLPRPAEVTWDEPARQLTIPFEFRPLTAQELITYGQKDQQDAIIARALDQIPKALRANATALAALTAERRTAADGRSVSYLEHHLRQYTRRNTSDFFIHKDLQRFLSRELDFYLKNEVLNLDEMERAGEQLAEGWLQLMRLIKKVGNRIIQFLAQIEDLQKLLWEKLKFVTETFYCITVGNIPEAFYPEIAACERQWEEWKRLYAIHELPDYPAAADPSHATGEMRSEHASLPAFAGRESFLKAHPTLVLDTRHFPPEFVDRLLASFDGLDDLTDGLLVHSENWQALNLLQEKYRERVKCVYIDPPYNTGSDEFLYKDGYQASSWAAMLLDRVKLGGQFLVQDGLFFLQIGDDEEARARLVLDQVFPERKNTVVVRRGVKNVQAQFPTIDRLTSGHDVIHVYARAQGVRLPHLRETHVRQKPGKWDTFWRGTERPTMRYELLGQNPQAGQWRWEESRAKKAVANYRDFLANECATKSLDEWYVENLQAGVDLDFVRLNEEGVVQYYVPPQGFRLVSDNWLDLSTAGDFTEFPTEKHLDLLSRIISWNTCRGDVVVDFFAGSGTTGHAVINLSREDGGRRKFILVEMADYFDTVLLPRIKKVTFSPEWREGKPKRMATAEEAARSPRIVKVIRLESYEDALNNLAFDESSAQMALQFEDYLLKYMLRWETRHSETLLNVEKLSKPFAYCLHIHRDGETRIQSVDLPETFNYLIGLDVQTRRVLDDAGRRYLVYRGTTRDGQRVAVIWRETEGWSEQDYRRDRDWVAAQKLAEGADLIYVNGDSLIPGARALEGVFKARMFAGVEG